MKLKILVLDNDKNFLNRLKRAFYEFYREEIECIDADSFALENINKSNCDILLVDKFYDISNFVLSSELTVVFFTINSNEINDYCIFKYSRAKEIYKKLNEIYAYCLNNNKLSSAENETNAFLSIQSNTLSETEDKESLYLNANIVPESEAVPELYLEPNAMPELEVMSEWYLESNTIPQVESLEEPYLNSNTASELNFTQNSYSDYTYETMQDNNDSSEFKTCDTDSINLNGTVCKMFMSINEAGATSVAIAKVGNLLEQGYKVLYLNLEAVPSTEKFFKKLDFEEEKTPAEFSYENLMNYLSSVMVCRNNGLYYFLPFEGQAREMISNVNGIRLLLDTLLNMNLFDYIIIDFTTSLDERLKLLYQYCESITLVTKGDLWIEPEYRDVEAWLIETGLFDKCRCLFSQLVSETTFDTQISAIGAIPKFDEEAGMKLVNRILTLGIINRI